MVPKLKQLSQMNNVGHSIATPSFGELYYLNILQTSTCTNCYFYPCYWLSVCQSTTFLQNKSEWIEINVSSLFGHICEIYQNKRAEISKKGWSRLASNQIMEQFVCCVKANKPTAGFYNSRYIILI